MAAIVIRYPDGTEQEHELAGQLTVGRADGNDLVLAEGGVSRKHARFFTEGADVVVEDTGSANGTFVDGEKIEGPTKVGSRAQVVIGDYEIKLKGGGAASTTDRPKAKANGKGGPIPQNPGGTERTTAQKVVKPPRATTTMPQIKADPAAGAALAKRTRPSGAAASSGPVLRGLTGPFMNKSFPLKGTMVVGRVAGTDVQLEDDSVSRRHAEVVMSGRTVVLKDLGSANGTTVNGQPLTGEVTLKPGDIIQFGVVEMAYENGAAGSGLSKRPSQGRPPPRGGRRGLISEDDDPSGTFEGSSAGLDPRKKKMLVGAGVGLALLTGGVLIFAFKTPGPDVNPDLLKKPMATQLTPEQQIEEYLSQCRQFSSVDLGEPNWEKAESNCKKVLDLEPIHTEANQLLARIKVERKCEDNFIKAKKQLSRLREDDALDALKEITNACSYYIKALPLVKEAMEAVKKRVGQECKEYSNAGKIAEALKPCERYMSFACQSMKQDDMYPPALKVLCLNGGGKNCWKPKDPMYVNLLKARMAADPKGPPWKCERITIYPVENNEATGIQQATNANFVNLYKAKELSDAVGLYFAGKATEGMASLQNRVVNNIEKAQLHEQAKNLGKQITTVEQLYKAGQGELGNNRPDKAHEFFSEALAVDEQLVLGPEKAALPLEKKKKDLDKLTSYYRRNINQDMASSCYARGKDLMDRQDRRQACKIWKMGFSYWRGNTDLLRAVTNVCTQEAARRLEAAGGCEDLDVVLEFAVDGDGHKEQVEKKKEELQCVAAVQ